MAMAQLLSEVVVSPADGATRQKLSTVVTLRARTGRLQDVHVLASRGPDRAAGDLERRRQRVAIDGQALARDHVHGELRGYRRPAA